MSGFSVENSEQGCHFAVGNLGALVAVDFQKAEGVFDSLFHDFSDAEEDFHHVAVNQRCGVFATGAHPGPTVHKIDFIMEQGLIQGIEKCTLGRCHILEIVAKMHFAGHIGLGKLYPAHDFEFTRHGFLPIYDWMKV